MAKTTFLGISDDFKHFLFFSPKISSETENLPLHFSNFPKNDQKIVNFH